MAITLYSLRQLHDAGYRHSAVELNLAMASCSEEVMDVQWVQTVVRKLRKKLRQIERLERLERELTEEELDKVSA